MKSMDIYKDAVMRRAEKKQQERRKARKRLLAVCVPLCLCIGIAAAFVPQICSVSSDFAPESYESVGNSTANADYAKATIGTAHTQATVTDPTQLSELYNTLRTLCGQSDGTFASADDATTLEDNEELFDVTSGGAGVPESAGNPEDGADEETMENNKMNGWRICFHDKNGGDVIFTLQDGLLADLSSGEIQVLSEEQLTSLTMLLEGFL